MARPLPPAGALSEHQQRGWRCTWCRYPLTPGYDVPLGEVRVAAEHGAAYTVFMRACADAVGCSEREAEQHLASARTEVTA